MTSCGSLHWLSAAWCTQDACLLANKKRLAAKKRLEPTLEARRHARLDSKCNSK